jgi:hypothetical protein
MTTEIDAPVQTLDRAGVRPRRLVDPFARAIT